jgi:hypothetical protein
MSGARRQGEPAPWWAAWRRTFVALYAVCLPVLALGAVLPRPIALSAWLGTAAIALHRPHRYRDDRARISAAYVYGFVVMVGVALPGALLDAPDWAMTTAGSIILMSSSAAGWHPPVACLPLAVSVTTPAATLCDWALLAVLTAAHLWCLSRVATALGDRASPR